MTDDSELLREQITDKDAEILRPINHAWLSDGEVSPDAFKLSSADKRDSNRLSTVQRAKTEPATAYANRAAIIKDRCEKKGVPYKPPVGVLGLKVEQVEAVKLAESYSDTATRSPLTVWDDSMNPKVPDDHAHIDHNDVPPSDKGSLELVAKALLASALSNGWKFRVSEQLTLLDFCIVTLVRDLLTSLDTQFISDRAGRLGKTGRFYAWMLMHVSERLRIYPVAVGLPTGSRMSVIVDLKRDCFPNCTSASEQSTALRDVKEVASADDMCREGKQAGRCPLRHS